VKGLSENIRVISIVGRFLEHSRIYYFHNAGNSEIYLGSADLMPRNINRRVEVLFPVRDSKLVQYLREEVLGTYLSDNIKARRMLPDGSYERVKADASSPPVNSQIWLLNRHQRSHKD
jgi:polyphosphate kinase